MLQNDQLAKLSFCRENECPGSEGRQGYIGKTAKFLASDAVRIAKFIHYGRKRGGRAATKEDAERRYIKSVENSTESDASDMSPAPSLAGYGDDPLTGFDRRTKKRRDFGSLVKGAFGRNASHPATVLPELLHC
ncbi:hypothetical protein Trydic_g14952 [Trypoxylus dichotomus]